MGPGEWGFRAPHIKSAQIIQGSFSTSENRLPSVNQVRCWVPLCRPKRVLIKHPWCEVCAGDQRKYCCPWCWLAGCVCKDGSLPCSFDLPCFIMSHGIWGHILPLQPSRVHLEDTFSLVCFLLIGTDKVLSAHSCLKAMLVIINVSQPWEWNSGLPQTSCIFGLVYTHNLFNWLITSLISWCSTWLRLRASLGTALFSTPKHLVDSCQLNDGMTAGRRPGSYVKGANRFVFRLCPLATQLFEERAELPPEVENLRETF